VFGLARSALELAGDAVKGWLGSRRELRVSAGRVGGRLRAIAATGGSGETFEREKYLLGPELDALGDAINGYPRRMDEHRQLHQKIRNDVLIGGKAEPAALYADELEQLLR
jgi:hypothetical protein